MTKRILAGHFCDASKKAVLPVCDSREFVLQAVERVVSATAVAPRCLMPANVPASRKIGRYAGRPI